MKALLRQFIRESIVNENNLIRDLNKNSKIDSFYELNADLSTVNLDTEIGRKNWAFFELLCAAYNYAKDPSVPKIMPDVNAIYNRFAINLNVGLTLNALHHEMLHDLLVHDIQKKFRAGGDAGEGGGKFYETFDLQDYIDELVVGHIELHAEALEVHHALLDDLHSQLNFIASKLGVSENVDAMKVIDYYAKNRIVNPSSGMSSQTRELAYNAYAAGTKGAMIAIKKGYDLNDTLYAFVELFLEELISQIADKPEDSALELISKEKAARVKRFSEYIALHSDEILAKDDESVEDKESSF